MDAAAATIRGEGLLVVVGMAAVQAQAAAEAASSQAVRARGIKGSSRSLLDVAAAAAVTAVAVGGAAGARRSTGRGGIRSRSVMVWFAHQDCQVISTGLACIVWGERLQRAWSSEPRWVAVGHRMTVTDFRFLPATDPSDPTGYSPGAITR